jgi:hypothetical protein
MTIALAAWLSQWLVEQGKSLRYRLADGDYVPIGDDELSIILAGIEFSPIMTASAAFHGEAGFSAAANEPQQRPGVPGIKPTTRLRILAEMRADVASCAVTLEELLRRGQREWRAARYQQHHSVTDWAAAQLANEWAQWAKEQLP